MTYEGLLLMILIILVLLALPAWPYSSSWGYGPTSGVGVLLVIILIWVLADHRSFFRSTAEDLKVTVQDAGHDLQSAGRRTADAIRNIVQ